jgi:pyrophosphatase PpaX
MFSFKGKKIIVFDLDYTIVKLTADWHALRGVLTDRYFEIYGKKCEFKSMSSCLSKIVEKEDWDELDNFFDLIRQYELENIEETDPILETIFFIKQKELFGISKDVKFAIFSLNTRKTILKSLDIAGIRNQIDLIIGREDVRKWKPEPEGLLVIQDYFKVPKEEVIFLGDSDTDIQAGQNAGIDAFYIEELINLVKKKMK